MKPRFQRRKPLSGGRGPNSVWLLLVALIALTGYLVWYNGQEQLVDRVNYSKFVTLVEQGEVKTASVQNQHVEGILKNGKAFEADVLPSDHLWELMRRNNVAITVYPQENQSWGGYLILMLSAFLLLMFGMVYFRQSAGGGGGGPGKLFSVGKSKAKFFSPNTINVTFGDVAGVHEAKEDLKDIIEFLKNPEKFQSLGAKIPRGILLSGSPGNGKTMLAKAVAGEASVPFFSISGSDFVEVFVGVGASRVRDLFAQAKKHSPCIVFIDEIDAVGRQRGVGLGGGNDEREQTLNQLLSEMDGFSTEHGAVIVLAATNRPDVLDKALMRPGRFDRVIEVPYPDLTSREEILRVHSKAVKLSPAVELGRVARGTPGFSGADLANLINEAALLASKKGKLLVEIEDFEKARDKLLLGAERKTLILTEAEKRRTAYHESGHTLLNVLLEETDPFHKVTIVPRGRALGVSWSLPEGDRHSHSRDHLLSRVMVCLGGRIAEKIIFNEQTSGASDDISKATKIARTMVCKLGMSSLGPIVFGQSQENGYLGSGMGQSQNYSEKTAEAIDLEIAKIIQECDQKAERMLTEHRDKLDILGANLLEKETLQAAEVYELLGLKPRETHSMRSESAQEDEQVDEVEA